MNLFKLIISAFSIFFSLSFALFAETINFPEKDLTIEMIERVKHQKIYFGHQSVGDDIIDGILDNGADINIVETNTVLVDVAYFAHSRIGENSRPFGKIDDFVKIVSNSFGSSADFVFLKFCYVDIDYDTNINELFQYYRSAMAQLSSLFPELQIVHFTVPLTSVSSGPKNLIKRVLGMPVKGLQDNIAKEEYNNLIRNEYMGIEPVFDLAQIESTKADGSRNIHQFKKETYYSLVADYTNDGGHLNELGRSLAASKLIKFLSEISAD